MPKTATEKELKAAHRKLARKHHPDVNPATRPPRPFKGINEVHEVLGDPEKRRSIYDELGANWRDA